MEQNQYIVALEIGSSKIVGALAEKSPSGMVSLTHLVDEKLLNCVHHGTVRNVENVKSCINRIIRNLSDRIDGQVTQVYVGVSGLSLHSEVSEVSRSLDSTKPITADIIEGIIRDASRNTVKNYETIDVVPRTVYVDKNETKIPVGQIGSSIKVKVNLIVAKPAVMINLRHVMDTSYGLGVKKYYVTPLVAGQCVLSESERSLGCMLVDFGAETTTVSIYKDDALVYLVTIPLGGRNLTLDIKNGCSVLEDTAERVKTNISNPLDPQSVDAFTIEGLASNEAASYIAARTGEIIANIDKQFEYADVSKDDIRSIVLIGGGAQLQGLVQKMAEVTKLKVSIGQAPKSLNIREQRYNRPEFYALMSIVARAAADIQPGETCIVRNTYEAPRVTTPEPATPEPPAPAPETVKRRGGILGRLKSMIENFGDAADNDTNY